MGVNNLWKLLEPVGRRVNVETLERKTLAVDVSIWLTQFIKAMRDDDGKIVKNAHLIGTFRRIVKLLFHRIRPVFVFDGGAPALKRRTVMSRKQRRENQERSLKKTAQRLLLAQLKKRHILTGEGTLVQKAGKKRKRGGAGGSGSPATPEAFAEGFNPGNQSFSGRTGDVGAGEDLSGTGSTPSGGPSGGAGSGHKKGSRGRLSCDAFTGRELVTAELDLDEPSSQLAGGGDEDDEEIDWEEAEEEEMNGGATAQPLQGERDDDEDDDDDAGGDILLEDDNVDVTVLASLPPELQKDVIESAKRRQRMQSRSQYMPVAGNPALYSQAQIANFLKSSQLNSKIMSLKDVKAEDGAGQRIASDGKRKFMLLKEVVTDKSQKFLGEEKNSDEEEEEEWEEAEDEDEEGRQDEGSREQLTKERKDGKGRRRRLAMRKDDSDKEEEEDEAAILLDAEEDGTTAVGHVEKPSDGGKRKKIAVQDDEDEDDDKNGTGEEGGFDDSGGGFLPEGEDLDDAPAMGGGFFVEDEPPPPPPPPAGATNAKPAVAYYSGGGVEESKMSAPPSNARPSPPPPPPTPPVAKEPLAGKAEEKKAIAQRKQQRRLEEEDDRELAEALHLSSLEAMAKEEEARKKREEDVVEILDDEEEEEQGRAKERQQKGSSSSSAVVATKKATSEVPASSDVADDDDAPPDLLFEIDSIVKAKTLGYVSGSSEKKKRGPLPPAPSHGHSNKKVPPGKMKAAEGKGRKPPGVVEAEEAYEHAIETASRLTTWAGRAVRRAIKQHMQTSSGGGGAAMAGREEGEAEGGDEVEEDGLWPLSQHEEEIDWEVAVDNDDEPGMDDPRREARKEVSPPLGEKDLSGPAVNEEGVKEDKTVVRLPAEDAMEVQDSGDGEGVEPSKKKIESKRHVPSAIPPMVTAAASMTTGSTASSEAPSPSLSNSREKDMGQEGHQRDELQKSRPDTKPRDKSSAEESDVGHGGGGEPAALPSMDEASVEQQEQDEARGQITPSSMKEKEGVVTSSAANDDSASPSVMEVIDLDEEEDDEVQILLNETSQEQDTTSPEEVANLLRSSMLLGDEEGGDDLLDDIDDEEALRARLRREMRDSEHVTQEMREEIMELLQLFGVPYLVSPMEAEAQCAALESLGLVDGVISDDSDCFLFGARAVYKNMFDDRKYVETYMGDDVQRELGLGRRDLVAMALLLGSDYTEGVRGVGIVNAAEIIRAFPSHEGDPPEAGLAKFREWLEGFDPLSDLGYGQGSEEADTRADFVKEFHRKHRNARNRWIVSDSFPDPEVFKAYLVPTVNQSTEAFDWSLPDLDRIRVFAAKRLGWPVSETDGMLLPMLKKMQERDVQTRINTFFQPAAYADNIKFAAIASKRLKKAVKGLTRKKPGQEGEDEDEEESQAAPKKKAKRVQKAAATTTTTTATNGKKKTTKKKRGKGQDVDTDSDDEEEGGDFSMDSEEERRWRVKSRRSQKKAKAPAAAAAGGGGGKGKGRRGQGQSAGSQEQLQQQQGGEEVVVVVDGEASAEREEVVVVEGEGIGEQ